jgi:hypothetical protein
MNRALVRRRTAPVLGERKEVIVIDFTWSRESDGAGMTLIIKAMMEDAGTRVLFLIKILDNLIYHTTRRRGFSL